MVKLHLKRLASPKTWPIKKKGIKRYVIRPMPSGHTFDDSSSLVVLIRDILKKAKTVKEVKFILNTTEVLVNGKRIKEEKVAVGFMDVVTFNATKENFRISFDTKGRIAAIPVDDKQAKTRLVKVENKTDIKGGKVQINCTGATNILVEAKEAIKIKTKSTLIIELTEVEKTVKENGKETKVKVPQWAIKETLELKEKALIYIVKGKHQSKIATLKEIKDETIVFTVEGNDFETRTAYAFVVGIKEPLIAIVAENN